MSMLLVTLLLSPSHMAMSPSMWHWIFLIPFHLFLYMTTIWLVINSQFHKQSKHIDELSFISFGSFNKITKSSLNMFQTMHGQIGHIYANLHKLEKFQHFHSMLHVLLDAQCSKEIPSIHTLVTWRQLIIILN
jgi:hypothetical protein